MRRYSRLTSPAPDSRRQLNDVITIRGSSFNGIEFSVLLPLFHPVHRPQAPPASGARGAERANDHSISARPLPTRQQRRNQPKNSNAQALHAFARRCSHSRPWTCVALPTKRNSWGPVRTLCL